MKKKDFLHFRQEWAKFPKNSVFSYPFTSFQAKLESVQKKKENTFSISVPRLFDGEKRAAHR